MSNHQSIQQGEKAPIELRPALVSDAEAIGRIRVSAWQAAYEAFMPKHFLDALDPLANLEALHEKLAQPTDNFMVNVADIDSSVVAFSILGSPRYATHIQSTELWALNVHPDFWRQGIGRALTFDTVNTAKTLGFQCVELWCIHGNLPACATYESCGFTLTGQERTSSTLTGHPLREILYTKAL